jgi:hypothetical protein
MNRSVTRSILGVALAIWLLCPLVAIAQQAAAKPYHEGSVWSIVFIRAKPGMEDRYRRYLTEDWKREQDAMKKAGYSLGYKVIVTEPHGPQDFNVILMTEFKDLTTLEANADKMEALGQQLGGGQPKVESGYQDRASYREVLAERLGREIILAPKGAAAAK